METNAESPGLLQATGCAEHLQRLEDAAAADVERIKFVYREIERRDGSANWHAALWFRFACLLAAVLIVAISAVVYCAMQASKVQAFVQPVQITEDGTMVLVGLNTLAWFSPLAFVLALMPAVIALLVYEAKILSGRMQIGLQDGGTRTFGPGEHFHSADTLPPGAAFDPALHGHWSAQAGDEPLVTLFVRS